MNERKKAIGVFCSANELAEKYTQPAEEFARLVAQNGYDLVWGGTDKGLMRRVASAARDGGSKLIGITIPVFKDFVRKDADEIIIADTLGIRKAMVLERSDVIVTLVGGLGTLDEITEIIELKRQKHHSKPILILDTDEFYEGLRMQLNRMADDGFLSDRIDDFFHFAETPHEALSFIKENL